MKGPPRFYTASGEEWRSKNFRTVGTRLALHYSFSDMNYFSWGCLTPSVVCKCGSSWKMGQRLEPAGPRREVGLVLAWELPLVLEGCRSHPCPGMSWGCPWGGMFWGRTGSMLQSWKEKHWAAGLRPAEDDVSLLMSNGRSRSGVQETPAMATEWRRCQQRVSAFNLENLDTHLWS